MRETHEMGEVSKPCLITLRWFIPVPSNLLFHGFFLLGVVDVEVTEFVGVLVGGNHTKPITEGVLLQILLREVLQIPLGERRLGGDVDLGLLPGDVHLVAQNTGLAVDLHTVVEKLLENRRVKESIVHRGRQVQNEFEVGRLLPTLLGSLFGPSLLDRGGSLSFNHLVWKRREGEGKGEREKKRQ